MKVSTPLAMPCSLVVFVHLHASRQPDMRALPMSRAFGTLDMGLACVRCWLFTPAKGQAMPLARLLPLRGACLMHATVIGDSCRYRPMSVSYLSRGFSAVSSAGSI